MKYFDIVFDGPPEHVAGRFIEVEDDSGKSISVGEWVEREDGNWALRIKNDQGDLLDALKEIQEGRGAFSMDHLTHATNTIEDMKGLAKAAIAKAEGK